MIESAPLRAQRSLGRTARRAAKRLRQRLGPRAETTSALFVVGAQRSGTTMLMDVLDALPDTRVYQEYHRAAFGRDWHLRPLAVRRRLVERARCRWVVFKPLLDLQHLDALLDVHPGSRAIFVLRGHRHVAVSSALKWGGAMREAVRRLATEEPCSHWMADRLPAARRARLAELYRPDLDIVSAAALRWWLRNELFFDLELDLRSDRVLTVRYEQLAARPAAGFAPLFEFLALPPDPASLARVSDRWIDRAAGTTLDPAVAALCEELEGRLDAALAAGPGAP